jgi:hypothetical protein
VSEIHRIVYIKRFSIGTLDWVFSTLSDKSEIIEIPSMVLKTRALLALRGFTTSELLEYYNRYVMLPTRDSEDVTLKYTIWVLKEEKVVQLKNMRNLLMLSLLKEIMPHLTSSTMRWSQHM